MACGVDGLVLFLLCLLPCFGILLDKAIGRDNGNNGPNPRKHGHHGAGQEEEIAFPTMNG
eukprot:CAMPEP_0168847572 /NCGR_PEP_ID=MMETSP0727-20121128/10388_1 /TAXON_ID=265536 /ORGANISM="Amphiprora sp., Strain CCMP467" /LENGTH=59 /DNA_ID=CAMNT_0008901383 /DNA_START=495 /DNA_END=674 /DNA_ORIENTATION=-